MPQMSPYNWLFLNFFFSLMFLMIMIILNFMFKKKKIYKKNIKNLIFLIQW